MGKKMQRRTTAGLGIAAGAGTALLFSLGNAPLAGAQPDDTAFTDLLSAQTDQFTAFSNNITANLGTSVAGDSAIFSQYLDALPNVGNAAALNGLQEVSGQLNDQLANTNANDLNGFNAVLGADSDVFGNLGGGTGGGVDEDATVAAIQAALSNAGLTDSNFAGGGLHDAAVALAASPDTDVLGDAVTGPEVVSALDAAGIAASTNIPGSGAPAATVAADLNDAAPAGTGGGLSDAAFSDVLGANTDNFTAFSNNLTANLGTSAGADSAIFGQYLGALPSVDNGAALNGLQEVSGQLNDQLANTNANDVNGLQDVLDATNNVATSGNFTSPADAIQSAFVSSGDFTFGDGVTGSEVATALANSDLDFGSGDITAVEVVTALANSDLTADEQADLGINFGFFVGNPYFDPNDVADGITFSPYDVADVLNSETPVASANAVPGDVLGAQTDLFTALSNNLTGNLNAVGNGDVAIFGSYLDSLPNVGNTAALNGLEEVSGQLNDQLANSNAVDVNGFDAVLDQDFTNLGDFLNLF
jgi:hypothetical protein